MFADREQFQLGSLSHYINTKANGYQELPPFPLEAPDPKARDVEMPPVVTEQEPLFTSSSKKQSSKKHSFYSESDSPGKIANSFIFFSFNFHSIFATDDDDEESSDEEDDDEEEEEETSSGKDGEESDTEDEESSEVEEKTVVIIIRFSSNLFSIICIFSA